MKPFEGSARTLGWVRECEMWGGTFRDGVVHLQGWWAPSWQEALRFSLEERQANYEENRSYAEA